MKGTQLWIKGIGIALLILMLSTTPLFATQNHSVKIDRIVVVLDSYRLWAFDGGNLVKSYPVAIGADTGPTPVGEYKIINKLKNPWYTPDDKPAKAPGPNNPLGTRWLGIDKPHYGIHGTKAPDSIGTAASAGCIRMKNADVEQLYEEVAVGAEVIIHNKLAPEILDQLVRQDPAVDDRS